MLNKEVQKKLKKIFKDRLLLSKIDKIPYLTDATDIIKAEPLAVVFPLSTKEVLELVKLAREYKIPLYPRGAGTSLSGGPVPLDPKGIVVSFTKMDRILEIREKDLQVDVEPGIVLDDLNMKLRDYNLFFPVDPASSSVATIGGILGENAGGVRAVKYGVTRNWVLSLEVVTGRGDVIVTGARTFKHVVGYDLTSIFVGSEGTLGFITKATLRLVALPKYKSVCYGFFEDQHSASEAVYKMIISGIDVTAVEFLDKNTLEAIKSYTGFEYKGDSMVIIEVSGNSLDYIKFLVDQIMSVFEENNVIEFKQSKNEVDYDSIWKIRKSAAPALANLRPHMFILDPTVPVSKIPEYVDSIDKICKKYNVLCATFGHAGDGNVHPNVLFDPNDPDEVERAKKAAREIYEKAIEFNGTISGEHGVGLEKLAFVGLEVNREKTAIFRELKKVFDPDNIINPGKAILDAD
ncbi:MAG: FAD-binding oxidoreductase [Candidatus Njordarchaeia archaeon]